MTTSERSRAAALVAFARPHTVVGTVVSVTALFLLALELPGPATPGLAAFLTALAGGLAVNVYIVGLNQLTDVELDRINKPWLPLASGALSIPAGRRLVAGSLGVAVAVGAVGGAWLLLAVVLAALLGTAYSLPPLRWKRHHALAAACIVVTRGLVVNVLIYSHYANPWPTLSLPGAVIALTAGAVALGLVIAWFKDLPDMEGDRRYAIGTLALRVGAQRVVTIGAGALLLTYAALAGVGLAGLVGLDRSTLVLGHAAAAGGLLVALGRLQLDDPNSVARFYQRIWLLFYAEYAMFTAAALLG